MVLANPERSRPLDIAIAGCGPAGLAAALLLHRDGHRVTMFERFDRPRALGSGLMIQPTGLAVLGKLGLADTIVARGSRVDRLFGQAANSRRTVLDVRYTALSRPCFGIGIHRASLFDALHDAAMRNGIPIETGRTIVDTKEVTGGRALVFADAGNTARFDLIVDALGTRTPLAAPTGRTLAYGALWASLDWPTGAGFDPHALEQRYRAASVMAGVLPIGMPPGAARGQAALFWSIRADRVAAWRAAGLGAWKADVGSLWPATQALLEQITHPDQLTFASYAHRTVRRPVEQALIHIGDAWHSASPQLGQGANMALLDAYALMLGLRRGASVGHGLALASKLRRRHVLLYQALTDMFTPVYQSDSYVLPLLRDWLVGPLSTIWPATRIQAALVAGLVGNPLRPLGLE
ncbi:FAD-dependent oxidoreductase [Sphingomonas endolithica]|uniref:FAD-dependent oxidoreductase n=1 Tax=Sphingomonas endolithica TaxID=2972485 RepID=UPI0021AEA804|nr:NAD(P)/FAD-dependent oxidoreductase [Sphingomonas sp. ZFBP2030]